MLSLDRAVLCLGKHGGAALLASLLAVGWAPEASGQDNERRSVLDGVYSEGQAERGANTFNSFCSDCHTAEEFSGQAFQRLASGSPVYALYQFMRFEMPRSSPGSLSPQRYRDVLAYILSLNEYPAGDDDLPAAASALREIYFPEVP